MMKESDLYAGNFLKAKTMMERGQKSLTLTIKSIATHKFDDFDVQRVLSFEEIDESLGLNKTNWRTLARLLDPDDDNWIGKQITIYTTQTDFQGKRVDCIRVDDRPQQAAPAAAPVASGNGAAGNPDAPFGEKWAEALREKLKAESIDIEGLVNEMATINRDHADKAKGRPLEEWPRCVMPTVKAAMESAKTPF